MSFQRECLLIFTCIFVCAITLSSCHGKDYDSPEGYDLQNPQKFELGNDLQEISGITFDEDNGNLLAISDSKRNVIEINLKKQKLKDYTGKVVPPQSDLEDLVKLGDTLYLLSSKGIIYQVAGNVKDSSGVVAYRFSKRDENFETLYYDPEWNALVMMCKECDFDNGNHARSAFKFDLQTKTFDTAALYFISSEEVRKIVNDKDAKFEPSAAAINPINKHIYILASAGKLLVVANRDGHVKEAYNLDPEIYQQPEGIAFAPNGSMFISNEGKRGRPTLLILKYESAEKIKIKK